MAIDIDSITSKAHLAVESTYKKDVCLRYNSPFNYVLQRTAFFQHYYNKIVKPDLLSGAIICAL